MRIRYLEPLKLGILLVIFSCVGSIAAQYPTTGASDRPVVGFPDNTNPGVNNNPRFGYYTTDAEMRSLISRLRSDQSLFRSSYNRWSRSNWRGVLTGSNADVNRSMTEFDQAIVRLNN